MPNQDVINANAERLATATRKGHPFAVGVTLSYVGLGSDKFWTGVWADDRIAVNFGPHHSAGQTMLHSDLGSREKAAAKMWQLLRSKCGKGYSVVDAALLCIPDETLRQAYPENLMIHAWNRLRTARAVNPTRLPFEPDAATSPRTPKQGGQVLLAVADPHANHDTLISAYDSAPSERFLPPLVLSHPACPEEARFLAALCGTPVI